MKTFTVIVILLAILCLSGQSLLAQGYDPRHTISVYGHADVKVAPNEVEISMSVETHNFAIDKAREENDSKTSDILSMARKYSIEDKYIQTSYMEVEPRYDQKYDANGHESERNFSGYYVTKHISVTLRDISKFEKFIAEALKFGTNYIQNTSFATTELRKYKDQARLDAIRAAKEKAMALAGELGLKLGKPIMISENGIRPSNAYDARWNFSSNLSREEANSASHPEEGSSVAPGELKVEADVSVTFELE